MKTTDPRRPAKTRSPQSRPLSRGQFDELRKRLLVRDLERLFRESASERELAYGLYQMCTPHLVPRGFDLRGAMDATDHESVWKRAHGISAFLARALYAYDGEDRHLLDTLRSLFEDFVARAVQHHEDERASAPARSSAKTK